MKKTFRIKKSNDFQAVFRRGKSVANRQFVLYTLKKEEQRHFRIGLSVSKKIGNAVKRNQIKRYIRLIIQDLSLKNDPTKDYVIIARKPVYEIDYHSVKKSLENVIKLSKNIDVKKR